MKIYTGNFANLKKYVGLHPISIALSSRYFNGSVYRTLNPDWGFKNDPEPLYTEKFNAKLLKLNRENVIKELSIISGSEDVILLCHEKAGNFCHRNLVAKWLEMDVEEFNTKKIEKEVEKELVLFE